MDEQDKKELRDAHELLAMRCVDTGQDGYMLIFKHPSSFVGYSDFYEKNGIEIPYTTFEHYPIILFKDNLYRKKEDITKIYERYRDEIEDAEEVLINDLIKRRKDNKFVLLGHKLYRPMREILKELGILQDMRGCFKKQDDIREKIREKVIELYNKLKTKKPLNIIRIQEGVEKYVNQILFPKDSKKAEKYYISDSTVRRIVNNFIKK